MNGLSAVDSLSIDSNGDTMLEDFEFLHIDAITGFDPFRADGVLGLSPGTETKNIVQALFDAGFISDRIFMLYFANLEENVSSVTFGSYDIELLK